MKKRIKTETQVKIKKEVNTTEKEKQVVTQRSEQKVQLQTGDKEVSNMENLKIKHYLYNAFIIENDKVKIAIDPGMNLLWYKFLSRNGLIPKSEWKGITHILFTHGDHDHYIFINQMARSTKAPVICGRDLAKEVPTKKIGNVLEIDVGEVIDVKEFRVEGLKVVHGPLIINLFHGLIRREMRPAPGKRPGLGSIGFKISLDDKVIVNLGDTLLLQQEWQGLEPDVLMIPIGGMMTMNVEEALEAVKLMSPKKVIPCHYNGDFLWQRKVNPANADAFKNEVEKMGMECIIMKYGEEIIV